ncbi:Acetyl esterase/lipase [Chitinophaga costaii]|uniref:Acetyl esterase/lipase n=1 Tax=Chitinophaga costaii TaxID=1335309 RepID=A0A1C4FF39_9BACT|nr:alpha/beta hydrolase [Chitinophaga costaii]PUZ20159.1 alpha/beta hydrolase [Chitinophaga costaii]SCC54657.1 Acetyl esterase/lipase [Chitinophaga costaii]
MKYILFLTLIAGTVLGQPFPAPQAMNDQKISAPITLWPNGAPGVSAAAQPEGPTKDIAQVAGKPIIRLTNVSQPTITVYEPSPEKRTGAAVVVCPGGGYQILAWDLEGTEVCRWLNNIGVTAVLLKYRVPNTNEATRSKAPLQDAQRALGYVRTNASRWKLDTHRIGILGFSAGGHLSAALSTNYAQRSYPPVDAADSTSCRPDFTLLIYPAYLTLKDQGDHLAPALPVNAQTPPTFLLQTQDDPIRVENSIYYYLALKNAGVPAEIHLYAAGGHGYGLRPTEKPVTRWPLLAESWMQQLGLLNR